MTIIKKRKRSSGYVKLLRHDTFRDLLPAFYVFSAYASHNFLPALVECACKKKEKKKKL